MSYGKIKRILEFENEKIGELGYGYDGWRVATDSETITVAISNMSQCCEQWGYFNTDDDHRKHIGAELFDVNVIKRCDYDDGPRPIVIPGQEYELSEGGAIFVDFYTSAGKFQLGVYNYQNGYYGHDVLIIRAQKEYV